MVPSEKVPVAVSCIELLAAKDAEAEVIVSDFRGSTSILLVTLLADGLTIAEFAGIAAAMKADPAPCPVAVPVLLPMEAMVLSDEVHVRISVISCVLLSLNVPVATSCSVEPGATTGTAGVIAMEARLADVTVSTAGLDVMFAGVKVAVTLQVAAAVPVATPKRLMVVAAVLLLHVSGIFGGAVEATDQET